MVHIKALQNLAPVTTATSLDIVGKRDFICQDIVPNK